MVSLRLESGEMITGTMVWYYFVCKREVWLASRNIYPRQDSPVLDYGRAVHETSYRRKTSREVELEGAKMDVIEERDGQLVVFEVKTSSKFLKPAKFQLLYYLFRLKMMGVRATGWLSIPKERKRIRVELDEESERELIEALEEIRRIASQERPPPPKRIPFCRRCAYNEFCWVE